MVQSLATLFKRVEEKEIPIQWRETKAKSVYKRGKEERAQESQTGIFLMNIVCKVYERVKIKMKIKKQIYQVCKLQERKTGQLEIT